MGRYQYTAYNIERLKREGWESECDASFGFTFLRGPAERRLLTLTPRDPDPPNEQQSFNPFRANSKAVALACTDSSAGGSRSHRFHARRVRADVVPQPRMFRRPFQQRDHLHVDNLLGLGDFFPRRRHT